MGLLFQPDALKGIPKRDTRRIKDKIDWVWANRRSIIHHPLKEDLSGFYKRRLAHYRIIYTLSENPDDMVVYRVGTRDDIYHQPLSD